MKRFKQLTAVTAFIIGLVTYLSVYPPQNSAAQKNLLKPYSEPIKPVIVPPTPPSPVIIAEKKETDSIADYFFKEVALRDKKVDQLIAAKKRVEVENAKLKERIRILELKTTMDTSQSVDVTPDSIYMLHTEEDYFPKVIEDTLLLKKKNEKKSWIKNIFNFKFRWL